MQMKANMHSGVFTPQGTNLSALTLPVPRSPVAPLSSSPKARVPSVPWDTGSGTKAERSGAGAWGSACSLGRVCGRLVRCSPSGPAALRHAGHGHASHGHAGHGHAGHGHAGHSPRTPGDGDALRAGTSSAFTAAALVLRDAETSSAPVASPRRGAARTRQARTASGQRARCHTGMGRGKPLPH